MSYFYLYQNYIFPNEKLNKAKETMTKSKLKLLIKSQNKVTDYKLY